MKLLRLLKRELSGEAALWIDKGIITPDQAEQILGIYGTRLPSADRRTPGYHILMAIAALFAGMALIVFISANWEQIPRAVRMGTLVAATAAANGIGLFYFRKDRIHLSRLWFFSGAIIYGAAIFLIAQIYHLGEHYPDGVLYWAVGVLPLGFLTDSILLMLLSGALSSIWLVMESAFGIFPTVYPLFAAAMLWFCFRQHRSMILFLLGIAGIIFFSEVLVVHVRGEAWYGMMFDEANVFFTAGVFILLHGSAGIIEKFAHRAHWVDYGLVLRIWCVRFGILTLFVLSFKEPWEELLRGSTGIGGFIAGCITVVPAVVAGFLWLSAKLAGSESGARLKAILAGHLPTLAYTCFYCLCSGAILLAGPEKFRSLAAVLQTSTNLVLLLTGIRMIMTAYRNISSADFYMGVGILLITALLRYIDLIGDYVSGSIVFLIAGGILFVTARLWKKHMSGRRTG